MSNSGNQLFVTEQLSIPIDEIHFNFVRSSGPGGQNVNKVNSQAQLFWSVDESAALSSEQKSRLHSCESNRINREGVLRIDCQTSRDREKNRQECLIRLRDVLVAALTVQQPRKKRRTPHWVKERRLQNKKERSRVKRLRKPPSAD